MCGTTVQLRPHTRVVLYAKPSVIYCGLTIIIVCMPTHVTFQGNSSYGAMMDLPVLIKRCNTTSRKLLGHYVELHGQRISQLVRQSVEAPNWLAVSEL